MKVSDFLKAMNKIDDEYLLHSEKEHNYEKKGFSTAEKILASCACFAIIIVGVISLNGIKGDFKKVNSSLGGGTDNNGIN
ncbi:MAG: hypothetical protein IKN54_01920, partial [Lachnospiraceae bacterium]|nr:hypothetical protein [Lachnospiraceae bacterium]